MKKANCSFFSIPLTGLALLWVAGCGAADSDTSGAFETDPGAVPGEPVIEEPDLYRYQGNTLYVQNPQTGLNILDVSQPDQPRLLGRVDTASSAGAELYAREDGRVILLLEKASAHCKTPPKFNPGGFPYKGEMVLVDAADRSHPRIIERYCVPGELVASRSVDDVVYLVTAYQGLGSRAYSVDISNPAALRALDQMDFPNVSDEIIVTTDAIFVAGARPGSDNATRVSYIGIDRLGNMTAGGSIDVQGAPQGRFHMDAYDEMFRVVTYDPYARSSILTVIDISTPSQLRQLGQLSNIGRGEQLKATRFDGERAYVVTYRNTDPLWVLSLQDPTHPVITGQLQVPGWSDFLFPRGETLLAVGRGDNGYYLGVSLFDVSDPTHPRTLDQVTVGDAGSTSEANVDFRGVTILEPPGANPVVVVPHTQVSFDGACEVKDRLQLVEVEDSRLQLRGVVAQTGAIRRSLLVDTSLYAISDFEVQAVDIGDLAKPRVQGHVTVGTDTGAKANAAYCQRGQEYYHMGDDIWEEDGMMVFCSVGAGPGARPGKVVTGPAFFGLALLALALRRRRHRS